MNLKAYFFFYNNPPPDKNILELLNFNVNYYFKLGENYTEKLFFKNLSYVIKKYLKIKTLQIFINNI